MWTKDWDGGLAWGYGQLGTAGGPDRIHPNASGHQLMADAFAALLLTGGQAP